MNLTKEEKKIKRNTYFREKYQNDVGFREYMKEKRKETYRKTGK